MGEKSYASWVYCLALIQFVISHRGRKRAAGVFGFSAAGEMPVFKGIFQGKWNTAITVTICSWFGDGQESLQSAAKNRCFP